MPLIPSNASCTSRPSSSSADGSPGTFAQVPVVAEDRRPLWDHRPEHSDDGRQRAERGDPRVEARPAVAEGVVDRCEEHEQTQRRDASSSQKPTSRVIVSTNCCSLGIAANSRAASIGNWARPIANATNPVRASPAPPASPEPQLQRKPAATPPITSSTAAIRIAIDMLSARSSSIHVPVRKSAGVVAVGTSARVAGDLDRGRERAGEGDDRGQDATEHDGAEVERLGGSGDPVW